MKSSDRYNKPFFYIYLALVLAVCSLETLVVTLVFDRPWLAFFLAILLGLLALAPLFSALDRISSGLGRLEIGQVPQVETQRDWWNPLIGLLRQLNRSGRLTAGEIRPSASLEGQEAALQERSRLGRELHDSIKQQLFSIQMSASAVDARWENDPQGARTALQDVIQSSQAALAEMNALLQQLSPLPLERVGLAQALKDQCEALAYRSGAEVTCEVGDLPAEDWLPVGAFEALFRVAQEALSNVARHARATHVHLTLQPEAARGRLMLTIRDDGLGFDPAGNKPGGGLPGMRSRLEALAGEFSLQSALGKGTTLQAALPLHPPLAEEAVLPVKADPFLNRAALVGMAGGVLAAALLIPTFDTLASYLGWGVSLGAPMIIAIMLLAVFTGWLSARWTKPATRSGFVLMGGLAGLIGGATAFGLVAAGMAAVDGATSLLSFGINPASVEITANLLYNAILGQFQQVHTLFFSLILLGSLFGAFGGLVASNRLPAKREGIAWGDSANLIFTLLALGSGLALIAVSPALMLSENALLGMVKQGNLENSQHLLWMVVRVLGTPLVFYLAAMMGSYGLLRREESNGKSAALYEAHWRAFNMGMLGVIVAAGMVIMVPAVISSQMQPLVSTPFVLGIALVSLVAAVPFFWQAVNIRQRLLQQLVKVPPMIQYLVFGASLLVPVLAIYGIFFRDAYWLFPALMLAEAVLVVAVIMIRRRHAAPARVGVWQAQLANGTAAWLAGTFALVLPMLASASSAAGILSIPVQMTKVLDQWRLGIEIIGVSTQSLVLNTMRLEAAAFGILLVLAGLIFGKYLLLKALQIATSKKRL